MTTRILQKQQEITVRFNNLSGHRLESNNIFVQDDRLSIYGYVRDDFCKVFKHAVITSDNPRYHASDFYACIDAPYWWVLGTIIIFDDMQLAMEMQLCGGWDEWYHMNHG